MNYSEQNYENVARYMDGENVPLGDMEHKLLAEVRGDMNAVADVMDTTVDSEVIDRVLRRHRKSPWRAASGLAAAAAVLVVAVAAWMLTTSSNTTNQPAPKSVANMNEVVETLATVQSIIEAQQELDIMTILVQNDNSVSQISTSSTIEDEDPWDMTAWANDLAG